MQIKRLTNKKDHLVAEGNPIIKSHLTSPKIILSVESGKGENGGQYNRVIMDRNESLLIAWQIIKSVAKSYLQNRYSYKRG